MIKTYDFKSPKKFTKERMNIVENLYESFSRSLATYLTGLMQVYCEVAVSKIEECRYQEYSNSGEDISMFGLLNLIPENREYNESPIVFEMEPSLCFFMIERLLGGQGTLYQLDREFTDIEMAILEHLFSEFTGFIQEAWNGYMDVKAVLTGLETNAHLLQVSAPEDIVVVVEMEVHVRELKARLRLVMPASNVEELTSRFGFKYIQKTKRREMEDHSREKIAQSLLESEVELRAIFYRFQLDAEEIVRLKEGDVLTFNKNTGSGIEIMVGDVPGFEAKLGHTKLRKAVQIEKVL